MAFFLNGHIPFCDASERGARLRNRSVIKSSLFFMIYLNSGAIDEIFPNPP